MISEAAVRRVHDFESLLELFRGEELKWDLDPDVKFDESTFDWSADDLSLSYSATRRLKDGIVRQLQPLRANQKWGLFFVEFTDNKIYRLALRQILRRLVPNRRRESHLATWNHENLLFICATSDYKSFTFAHFRGAKSANAKLSTFGWQVGDRKLRTLCEFNMPALVWPKDDGIDADAWISNWSKAFDKEPLTRDFFKRFDKALEKIKADLEEVDKLPPAAAHTKSQLLLERLIFLYYLQNRGWLNQQRNYLLDNFAPHRERPKEYSYYSDFLEKLFWTLASPPGSAARIYGIPFLNGGLFDDDEFAQNPMRRKHNPPLSIKNSTFTFVFDEFLEAFNFTVREDTPLNQEVAVDPEMLGKVFESIVLHAEAADPDAIAPDKRKATGSYYTPRIVVHFICQETLRQYLVGQFPDEDFTANLSELIEMDASEGLDKDELQQLKKLLTPADASKILPQLRPKCCDPAVGSGAFPVGLLHELVNLRRVVETVANGYVDPIRKYGTQWLHETKSDIIQNCLYGVDIQQQAIEICQLRLWLSLVVDYDLGIDPFTSSLPQFREAIERISQLPNLEMNFRRGDSLYDYISGVPLLIPPDQSISNRKDFEAIKKFGAELHVARKGETKRKLRLAMLERRLDISERVLALELEQLRTEESTFINRLFNDEAISRNARQKRVEEEIRRVEEAQRKTASDRRELNRLEQRVASSDFQQKLRKLEGADFDSPLNFSWQIDLASILKPATVSQTDTAQWILDLPGDVAVFDIIVGNPPFVTARNPEKRGLYRERWNRVCAGKYSLVSPFFQRSFGLLRPGGQLGFIVSNSFAKRDFGIPLVEDFFPHIDLQKVIDCSGLMFPGHGTPTNIIFGRKRKPDSDSSIRVATILPGGGDLRTSPEDSALWQTLEENHDQPSFMNSQVVVDDIPRIQMAKWPWNLDALSQKLKEKLDRQFRPLKDFLPSEMGVALVTGANEIFAVPAHVLRVIGISRESIVPYVPGEEVRNWAWQNTEYAIFPYLKDHAVKRFGSESAELSWLGKFKATLESRIYFGKTPAERGLQWYEYAVVVWANCDNPNKLIFPDLATHSHFVRVEELAAFNQHTPVLALGPNSNEDNLHLLAGLTNSSTVLFWLKQVCFNKGAGADEKRDRFEFAGGRVQELPVPDAVTHSLQGKSNASAQVLTSLSQACWERGQELRSLALLKLFEKQAEAFDDWNSTLPGYVGRDMKVGEAFSNSEELAIAISRTIALREDLRAEMIALQEEMDWLIYSSYGLVCDTTWQTEPLPLSRDERPFQLWIRAGNFNRAVIQIPKHWPEDRQELWRKRLELIRDNEDIRRIEQPVYKRRWDEQWKVGNRWQCGQPAYDAELIDAFSWWLSEKAEWWLEQHGDPVRFDTWAAELWKDTRIRAAWHVVAEALHRLELWKSEQKKTSGRPPVLDPSAAAFTKFFKALVKDQTVPEGIPFDISYDKLKTKVSAHVKRIRGKLNVPRERFNVTGAGLYRVATPFDGNAGSETRSKTGSSLPFE